MDDPRSTGFIIPASVSAEIAAASNLSVLYLLPTLVRSSLPLARPPISNYHVAAVGLGSDGRIFVGVNLEFPGAPLHHSVHAEQFLVTSLAAHGGGRLLALAVSAAPCGHCRQFLQELRGAAELQICIMDGANPTEFRPLISILPLPFGPFDLLDNQSPLLLEPNHNRLSLAAGSATKNKVVSTVINISGKPDHPQLYMGEDVARSTPNSNNESVVMGDKFVVGPTYKCENGSVTTVVSIADTTELCNGHWGSSYSKLEIGALEAANKSHAPYSNCPSGVSLMDCEGKIYKGSYMESAAYNPSLGPVQAAVVAYVAAGGGEYDRIVAGVLVEREGAVVRQDDTARLLLKLIAPKCEIRVIHCSSD